MNVTQITFVAKNPKCVSVKPKRYFVNTTCSIDAISVASELLKNEKHYDKYKALPALIIKVHDV